MDLPSSFGQMAWTVLPFLNSLSAIRAILGVILVFFLPGFVWTLVFFRGRTINTIERIALSFGLSIAAVTLSILSMNVLFGVSITTLNSILIILVITIMPLTFYYLSRFIKGRLSREN